MVSREVSKRRRDTVAVVSCHEAVADTRVQMTRVVRSRGSALPVQDSAWVEPVLQGVQERLAGQSQKR